MVSTTNAMVYVCGLTTTVWRSVVTYITDSIVEPGQCESDARGPPELKTCLEEYPDHVYYIYSLTQHQQLFDNTPVEVLERAQSPGVYWAEDGKQQGLQRSVVSRGIPR